MDVTLTEEYRFTFFGNVPFMITPGIELDVFGQSFCSMKLFVVPFTYPILMSMDLTESPTLMLSASMTMVGISPFISVHDSMLTQMKFELNVPPLTLIVPAVSLIFSSPLVNAWVMAVI